mmetsp:Transcript_61665/g.115311  ORF Transcript_61665/g.115311 Transcript_61665/m.115311 type:complete len:301 (-) Transcript_61665:19-921(-)
MTARDAAGGILRCQVRQGPARLTQPKAPCNDFIVATKRCAEKPPRKPAKGAKVTAPSPNERDVSFPGELPPGKPKRLFPRSEAGCQMLSPAMVPLMLAITHAGRASIANSAPSTLGTSKTRKALAKGRPKNALRPPAPPASAATRTTRGGCFKQPLEIAAHMMLGTMMTIGSGPTIAPLKAVSIPKATRCPSQRPASAEPAGLCSSRIQTPRVVTADVGNCCRSVPTMQPKTAPRIQFRWHKPKPASAVQPTSSNACGSCDQNSCRDTSRPNLKALTRTPAKTPAPAPRRAKPYVDKPLS